MKSFQSFGLHPKVADGVVSAGFRNPTPIQAQAIPKVRDGRDVLGLAQTGTGKTAAFVLPILHRLMPGKRGVVRALIVAPTRELAEQTHAAISILGRKTGLRSTTIYGGVSINSQISRLRGGVEILVACPGRLLDHMARKTVRLSQLEILVLDEADQMFDMGFLPDIRRIIAQIPRERQTLLFSATMPNELAHLVKETLRQPEIIKIGMTAPAATVRHALFPVASQYKTAMLMKLLRQTKTASVLIFTRTKHRAKRLGETLSKAGYRSASLQGNLSQNRRKAAMDGFRDGTFQILVATDIAARGIDVTQVSHVINYDIPNTPEAYIHRIGRTGRACRSGDAFTLVTDDDKSMVRAIDRILGTPVERRTLADLGDGSFEPRNIRQKTRSRSMIEKPRRNEKKEGRSRTKNRYGTESRTRKSRYGISKDQTSRPAAAA